MIKRYIPLQLTQTGILTQPKKSSCEPWRADWHTCLKNLPNPLTPLTSFSRETASSTLLSSSWSQISRCRMSEWMSSISLRDAKRIVKTGVQKKFDISTNNLNFSCHFGLSVCGLTEVARMNLAGTGPTESRCWRPSLRLKLNRKLWCLRSFPCSGESRLSMPVSESVRGVIGGCGEGGGGVPEGCMPSIQYGSLKPVRKRREKVLFKK